MNMSKRINNINNILYLSFPYHDAKLCLVW